MKKRLLQVLSIVTLALISLGVNAQTRYVDEVFQNYNKVSDIEYDSNRTINLQYQPGVNSPIITAKLRCDIYTPTGDTIAKRPVIILAHTGSYLPAIINQQPTGNKNDSSIVEMATKFAKRGYVVFAINYRLGWNPQTTVQVDAAQQLIKATYRAIQDVRNAIRFARTNATAYGIDTSKIIVGGQGTGGYVALGVAAVDKVQDIITNPKFQIGFDPMINIDTLGDWNGLGGLPFFNYGGETTVSGNAHMVFNIGGAMGDSAWMDNNTLPIVGLQCPSDPYAPYRTGNVVVPGSNITVIPSASGAGVVVPFANSLGINSTINARAYNDAISVRGLAVTSNTNNLYPFITGFPYESAPWEWWDRPTVQSIDFPSAGAGRRADSLSMLTNPMMSATRGKAYCDTIVRFVAPRIAAQFSLSVGVKEVVNYANSVLLFPNPAKDVLTVSMDRNNARINEINIFDVTGKLVNTTTALNSFEQTIHIDYLNKGIYLVNIKLDNGASATKRLVIE
ncbi:MAG: T9SS type A sorting domain-containing protein [Bacteroidota bacterium]